MDKTIEIVSQLLGDYYNSEQDLYIDYKQKLNDGIWLKFKGPKIKPLTNNFGWVNFLEIISKGTFAINYEETSMDANCNFWFFADERMECIIECQGKKITQFKTDFIGYESYNINQQMPELVEDRVVTYRVFLKLTKSGELRKAYENMWFNNPSIMAQEFLNNIQKGMTNFPKSSFAKYPTKVNLMKRRLSLWGHNVKTKKQLLSILPSLAQQDFGIKDVIALELLSTIFFNEKLGNEKMMSNVQGIVKARRKVRYEPG